MTFAKNWDFSEQHIDQIKEILRKNSMYIVNVEVAKPDEDMKQSTDLKVTINSGCVAVRIRRPGYEKYKDITIRAYKNGYKTEIHKLREGFADWYLYAWASHNGTLSDWVLLDINKMRPLLMEERYLIKNGDGSGFYAYKIMELIEAGALVASKI